MSAKIRAITISETITNPTPKFDYLRELSGGDQNFITEILEMFIKEAPQSVEQSFRYLEEGNLEMLRITIHKLKSSVQVVGGYHLTNLIQEIESGSNASGKPELIQQMLTVLNIGIQSMVEHLSTEVQTLNSTQRAA